MRRREFISALGGASAWPLVTHAQQTGIPVIGFLRSTPSEPFPHIVAAFQQGLREAGLVEGQNVQIERRWADNHPERLPSLAADLIDRKVAVIVGNGLAAEAAKAATTSIPIIFVTSDDPVERGFVTSLNRPGGNLTGITFFGGGHLGAKRVELLKELVPEATVFAFLMDPNSPGPLELRDVEAAARALGREIAVVEAASESAFDGAFAKIAQRGAGALIVSGSPIFTSSRGTLVALAARDRIPAIYDVRDHVASGGLMSYSASFTDAYRQAGVYAARILAGAKPADLPVVQPTNFELVINLKTANALGLTIPPTLLARADEVIE